MWPFANKSYDVALWSVAAQHRGDISLCLGLENISSAVNSLFANVTVEQFPADARIGYTVQRAQQRETLIPGVPPNLHPMSGQPEIQGISDADKGPSSEEQSHSEWLNELGKWIKRLLALLFGALDAVVGEVIKPKEKNPGQPQQRSAQPADQARRWSPRVTPSTAPPSSVCPIHEMIPDWQKQAEKSKVFKDEQPSRYTSNIFTRSSKDKGGVQVAGDGSSSNNHNNGDVDRKVQLS
ncbi:MAG: hypothetical protein DYG89_43600 [Caldilinea sp. CFX5]|nr:hypothetical protein [Caldilinea sp. CFX5]